jgi:hypothetical protein
MLMIKNMERGLSIMKKQLGKKQVKNQEVINLTVSAGCSGCGSVPSWDYINVQIA